MATILVAAGTTGVSSPSSAQILSHLDSVSYADAQTAELVVLARARHQGRSLQLASYGAKIFSRVEGRVGGSRFGRGFTVFAYETAANLRWSQPGDVRVDVTGARSAGMRMPGVSRDQFLGFWEEIFTDEPWFVPGAIGDEIQMMGIPDHEAIHPLARGAEDWYHYAVADSLTLVLPDRTVRAISVRVTPRVVNPVRETTTTYVTDSLPPDFNRRLNELIAERVRETGGVSSGEIEDWIDSVRIRRVESVPRVRRRRETMTLVAGEMWLDADSLDVVRMTVTFVGDGIWDDDDEAPELVKLEADLEYGLHQSKYWLPYRQLLSAEFKYKYLPGAHLPATAVTTFSDHEISESLETNAPVRPVARRRSRGWRCPDLWDWDDRGRRDARCGTRPLEEIDFRDDGTVWHITVPDRDSLESYQFGFEMQQTEDLAAEAAIAGRLAKMAALTETLPDSLQAPGLRKPWMTVDWEQAYRAFQFNRVQGVSLGWGSEWTTPIAFSAVHGNARFGFGDRRPNADLFLRREAPAGRFEIGAYRKVREAEPWTSGLTVGNSLKALFAGHDDADYYLGLGGSVTYHGYSGFFRDVRMALRAERQRSMRVEAGSAINDVFFGALPFQSNPPVREGDYLSASVAKTWYLGWTNRLAVTVGVEGMASDVSHAGRAWTDVLLPFPVSRGLVTARLRAGAMGGDPLPQLRFRLGGPYTVRGYDYGYRLGARFWSAQVDYETSNNPWWSPVFFSDVGQVSGFGSPMVGVGAGVSLFSGWMRLDLAKGVHPSARVRFDVIFRMPG